MVRMERLELSRLAAPEPKSGVYTNFTTSAKDRDYTDTLPTNLTYPMAYAIEVSEKIGKGA